MVLKNKIGSGGAIAVIVVILVLFLVWGLLGANEAKKVGTTCNMGVGTSLCWTWHKNIVGQIQEGISNTGNAVSNLIKNISG